MDKDSIFFRLLRVGLGIDLSTSVGTADAKRSMSIDVAFAIQQGVGAFVFDGLQKGMKTGELPLDTIPREQKMKLFSHTVQVEKQCRAQYERAAELADIYAEHGIRTVVLKGIAAGTCYPNPWHRPCGDLDCFLFDKHEEGNRIAKKLGTEVDPFHYKHSHIKYKGLMVENHRFCTAVRGSRKMKRFERLLQSLLEEEGTTRIGDTHLECPSPLFNALFLTIHGRNHFLLEGIALRHLCDWAMLIHKHGDEIDWKRFTSIAAEYGLRDFSEAMTRLSVELLGIVVPERYDVGEDAHRDNLLREAFTGGVVHESSGGSVWRTRQNMIKRFFSHSDRHKLFSDISVYGYVGRLVLGFLFDRNPRI